MEHLRQHRHRPNLLHPDLTTHSLDDLAAVDTVAVADRTKTRGLLDRCAITAMSDRELGQITRLRLWGATRLFRS